MTRLKIVVFVVLFAIVSCLIDSGRQSDAKLNHTECSATATQYCRIKN